jgi:alpha-L-fucosidase
VRPGTELEVDGLNTTKNRSRLGWLTLAVIAVTFQATAQRPVFEPTVESLKQHEVPQWFHDAKFGIFIHWGIWSVPAFAPQGVPFNELAKAHPKDPLLYLPYSEWYQNAMRSPGSQTADYHKKMYGEDYPYDNFRVPFEKMLETWDPEPLADLIEASGAEYVVFVTKHHDGYCLWPTGVENPYKKNWHSKRDVVGEVAAAVRKRGIRFGVYYSGGFDWTFDDKPMVTFVDSLKSTPTSQAYRDYCDAQYRELIERYHPDVLWNDIAYPPGPEMLRLWADFYNGNPDGVINNRWAQPRDLGDGNYGMAASPAFYDYLTPEYTQYPGINKKKWETTRGISDSFGYNRNESPDSILKPDELIRMVVDSVSKNGNVLLNIGPTDKGTIPPGHDVPLLALGEWLEQNGEAIYGTRPWERAEGVAISDGDELEVRFTQKGDAVYAIVLGTPKSATLRFPKLGKLNPADVQYLGPRTLEWGSTDTEITITATDAGWSDSYAHVFKITLP